MIRPAVRLLTLAAIAVTVALPAADTADARTKKPVGQVLRLPGDITLAQLPGRVVLSEEPLTIVFDKGDYVLPSQLFIFSRSNLTLCGATGRAQDVTLFSGGGATNGAVIQMEQVRNVTLKDLTIQGTADSSQAPGFFSQGVRLNAQLSSSFSSFVDGVTIDGCIIRADLPIEATARVRNLTVARSTLVCTDGGTSSRSAISWGDGDGLFVTKTRFQTDTGVSARTAVFVQGASIANADGERAQKILLTRNRIAGDFLYGFDLADVREVRVRGNRFDFSGGTSQSSAGRVGVIVRRAASSSLPEDYEITRNRARNAHYGAWMLIAGQGRLIRNDFRRCGAAATDAAFGDFGGGVRIDLFSANCLIELTKNDLRSLNAAAGAPAVTVVPSGLSGACFDEDDDGGNKTSRGRELYLGANDQ